MTLAVEHGAFSHPGGQTLLHEVNFTVQSGDLLAILGPNGVGKTTLLRCMMGFLRWQRGRSTLDGTELRSLPPRALWQQLAYVPQARHATAAYTVEETVLLGRSSRIGVFSQPSADDVALVRCVLEELGIAALRDQKCTQLSGGELQMTLLARALAQQPRVLVLDEPESNLDFKNQLVILQTLSRLVAQGMTCVFNTHYPAHALQRANKSLLLTKGGEALFGATADIVTEANIERAFGVKAAIGCVETDETEVQSVVPLALSDAGSTHKVFLDGNLGDGKDTGGALHGICQGGAKDASEATGTAVITVAGTRSGTSGMASRCAPSATRIAAVAIIANSDAAADKINALLHAYQDSIIGRMGMPYPSGGVHIINVTLDAPEQQVRTLAQQLTALPGVSVKATFAHGAAAP